MKKTLLLSCVVAVLASVSTFFIMDSTVQGHRPVKVEQVNSPLSHQASYVPNRYASAPLDFTETADKVVSAVVNISSTQEAPEVSNDPRGNDIWKFFFDDNPFGGQGPRGGMPSVGTGSGVIISSDGYIITNNHVIKGADKIDITLTDNRSYAAKVIGTDPTTDLAVVKIDADNLPTVGFFDSDEMKVGEWVLAVGNPFGLTSTVTAGIISAKGRSINILQGVNYAIESFIQTDAAINPGNSGGALVNLNGDLIGINTAIASPTGSYSGYGFAVPSNIVKKVMEDLIEYGTVQRGVLGVRIQDVNAKLAEEQDLKRLSGIYVAEIMETSAAGDAGVQQGDVITAVNGVEVNTSPELQVVIGQHRPGESVQITVDRRGQERDYTVVLNNREGTTDLAAKVSKQMLQRIGVEVRDVEPALAERLDIDGGAQVTRLYPGKLKSETKMREGFIMTHVDGSRVKNAEDLAQKLENKTGGVMIEGRYEGDPETYYYALGL